MEAWATARDLARLYDVKLGTIYAWASQDHWRRTTSWPKRYSWDDAQDSYEKRHPHPLDTPDQRANNDPVQ